MPSIGLIHATLNSINPINLAFKEHAPDVDVLNFLDEGLIQEVNRSSEVTAPTLRRFFHLIEKAVESDVDGILVCCTVFTPYVKKIAELFEIPIIANDYAMLSKAVETSSTIGLIATVKTAGPTSEKLLVEIADELNKEIEVKTEIVTEAFAALSNGDKAEHDRLIHQKYEQLKETCGVVVLAQLSMTGAADTLTEEEVPVLTSKTVGIESLLQLINQ